MVAWYKHDIPAWMDGTEALSDGAYRAYHVICQLIYLNEGPIALNEHGIAGRCKQSIRAFRRNLEELIQSGKLTLENGRLRNSRADSELEKVDENRMNAGKGGENSGKSRIKSSRPVENLDKPPIPLDKPLKTNDQDEASLQDDRSLKDKTRREETRREETRQTDARETRGGRSSRGSRLSPDWKPSAEERQAAKMLGLTERDIEKIWPVYRDHWLSAAGEKGVKLDWVATWRNWCRRDAEKLGRQPLEAAPQVDWRKRIEYWAKSPAHNRSWFQGWGPAPDQAGCEVPRELLIEFGAIEPEPA